MSPLIELELQLAARTAGDEPVGARPAQAIAEHQVQTPGDLVDEVIHVGLMSAVVIAREQDPGLAIEKHPAREVNRLHPRQIAAREDITAGELNGHEHQGQQPAAEPPGFHGAERGVLVRDVVVFDLLQLEERGRVRRRADLRIRGLEASQPDDQERQQHDEERQGDDPNQQNKEGIRDLRESPQQRGRLRWREQQAAGGLL